MITVSTISKQFTMNSQGTAITFQLPVGCPLPVSDIFIYSRVRDDTSATGIQSLTSISTGGLLSVTASSNGANFGVNNNLVTIKGFTINYFTA